MAWHGRGRGETRSEKSYGRGTCAARNRPPAPDASVAAGAEAFQTAAYVWMRDSPPCFLINTNRRLRMLPPLRNV